MDAREAILARIEDALGRSQTTPAPMLHRDYRTDAGVPAGAPAALDLLTDRLEDYRARVHRCTGAELPAVLGGLLAESGTVVVPPGLPAEWQAAAREAGAEVQVDEPPLAKAALDAVGAVLTGARVAIAETGTIVLDGEADQGRRAITLIPDHHVCVLRAEQVVVTVPEAVAVLGRHPERPMTWVAGPSATSDIELERVEGVHGPRTLDVLIVS